MKKLSSAISFISAIFIYFALAIPSFAASTICPTGQFGPLCNLKLNSSTTIVGSIVTIMLILAVVLCLFFLILGGIRWIMSGGDKAKVDSARGTITSAIVGLIIAFLAFFFLNIITFLFTKNSITSFTIPTLVP